MDSTCHCPGFDEVDIRFDDTDGARCPNARVGYHQQAVCCDVQRARRWIVAIHDGPIDAGDHDETARQAQCPDADIFHSRELNTGASIDSTIEHQFATTIKVAEACSEDDSPCCGNDTSYPGDEIITSPQDNITSRRGDQHARVDCQHIGTERKVSNLTCGEGKRAHAAGVDCHRQRTAGTHCRGGAIVERSGLAEHVVNRQIARVGDLHSIRDVGEGQVRHCCFQIDP